MRSQRKLAWLRLLGEFPVVVIPEVGCVSEVSRWIIDYPTVFVTFLPVNGCKVRYKDLEGISQSFPSINASLYSNSTLK
jgi:hypothetical protein